LEASVIKDVMPVITALIVSISTLLGIYLTNKFNSKQVKVNLEFTRDQKMLELRLQKLEELYLLFEQWEAFLLSTYLIYSHAYAGKLNYTQVLDTVNQKSENDNIDFHKIQMLLNIYFPELRENYENVISKRSSLAKYILSDPSKNNLKTNDFFNEQEEFEILCTQFKNKLSDIQKLL